MDSEIIVFGHHSHWPGNTLLMGQHLTYHDISSNIRCLNYLGSSCLPLPGPNSKFDFGRPVGWFSISKLTFDFSIPFLKLDVRHRISTTTTTDYFTTFTNPSISLSEVMFIG